MHLFVGTSGYSYPSWRGSFYPARTKPADMLAHYATRLPSVEINNTFYRLPRRQVMEGWAAQTGDDFRFAIKASRRITHFQKLRDAAEPTEYLVRSLSALGARLGSLLLQLPPTLPHDPSLLDDYLSLLRETAINRLDPQVALRVSVEVRHPSWFVDATHAILERHAAALVVGDENTPGRSAPLVRTTDHLYLRLRKDAYEPEELDEWAEAIHEAGASQVFVYFKHEERGPELAHSLLQRFRA